MCACLAAFITSRFMLVQVVNVVLVQFTQFRADTGNVLIHLASEIGNSTRLPQSSACSVHRVQDGASTARRLRFREGQTLDQ